MLISWKTKHAIIINEKSLSHLQNVANMRTVIETADVCFS